MPDSGRDEAGVVIFVGFCTEIVLTIVRLLSFYPSSSQLVYVLHPKKCRSDRPSGIPADQKRTYFIKTGEYRDDSDETPIRDDSGGYASFP